MPFGLTNAAQFFQRFMDCVLRELDFCFCYIDDILIASRSEEEHKIHLDHVLSRLQEHSLTLNLWSNIKSLKCVFGKQDVNYFGHCITANEITPSRPRYHRFS